jgi:radical SAM superfamily enzyme YgiQ (UPF0313 family)
MGNVMKKNSILLITPPFVQPNSPYPATQYLTGYLKKININATQKDLSLDTLLTVFTSDFLKELFATDSFKHNDHFAIHFEQYLSTIDKVIYFLQGHDPSLAKRIVSRKFLPEGERFTALHFENSFFTETDFARYLATLYIEDIFDYINRFHDSNFELSRYAECLGLDINFYKNIYPYLNRNNSIIEKCYLSLLDDYVNKFSPDYIGFTVPFPGTLLSSLKSAYHIKSSFPDIEIIFGGGYVSTELDSISNDDFFSTVDYLVIGSGEKVLEKIVNKQITLGETVPGLIYFYNQAIINGNSSHFEPDRDKSLFPVYDGLKIQSYLPLVETSNPMMRLWNDTFWNKLTIAYGCYWGKCGFCDTTLDYIKNYKPLKADEILKRIRSVKKETGVSSFHFTDEAAPPGVLKSLSLELIEKGEIITYWTNIRFEKSFSKDLARLLHLSGCIALSGGIEVASNRILSLMKKGVSVEDVILSTYNLSSAGIMIHAYLMYGFPTQTVQETIDALEIVRQMFLHGLIDSAYYHRFALTRHSYIYCNQSEYKVQSLNKEFDFAYNDVEYKEQETNLLEKIGNSLKEAVSAYMKREKMERDVHTWFPFSVPGTIISRTYVEDIITTNEQKTRLLKSENYFYSNRVKLIHHKKSSTASIKVDGEYYELLLSQKEADLLKLLFESKKINTRITQKELTDAVELSKIDIESFYHSELWYFLRELSLIAI